MTINILSLIPLIPLAAFIAWLSFHVGRANGRDSLDSEMSRLRRYQHAVDDLDRWCGHTSPHARLISRHLIALGEGKGCNAGTPADVEPCTIDGLRVQLKKLDVIESTLGEHAVGGDRLRAAMQAYDRARVMQTEAKKAVNDFVGDPANYVDAPSVYPVSRA